MIVYIYKKEIWKTLYVARISRIKTNMKLFQLK